MQHLLKQERTYYNIRSTRFDTYLYNTYTLPFLYFYIYLKYLPAAGLIDGDLHVTHDILHLHRALSLRLELFKQLFSIPRAPLQGVLATHHLTMAQERAHLELAGVPFRLLVGQCLLHNLSLKPKKASNSTTSKTCTTIL